MPIIDAHLHLLGDDRGSLELLERFDLFLINICVAMDDAGRWRTEGPWCARQYRSLAQRFPHRYAWVTSFDLPRFETPGTREYADRAIAQIDEDLAAGAVGVKVWKNIGMEVRKPDGSFMLVDDPLLEPIFRHLEKRGVTLLMHIADPIACWRPLDEDSPHVSYYRENPQWHLHGKPGYPSHETLMAARDRVVARHPRLRVVGAHLGSLEHDVAELARRFDAYPNFVADLSARIMDLFVQDQARVRAFFLRYADRLLFGTDLGTTQFVSELPAENRTARLDGFDRHYRASFAYLERAEPVALGGYTAPGLALPRDVLDQVYRTNARRCYPLNTNRSDPTLKAGQSRTT